MADGFVGISNESIASADSSQKGANYLRFPVLEFFVLFPFCFFDCLELLLPFFLEVSLSASSAGWAADAAKETVFPFVFFVFFVFFGKAPRGVLRAPLPFKFLVALTID